ncbi:hypothetical protein H9I45_15270 [Polaribacter haliotis]|uniref:PLD phosphodiesterase domain-containing protein n=1 Tax=Polaribacter haliotis TaxID=1888915 RepID=A0A7L8AFT7_9FLAO|nr:hypothetical protein [Polaribacter haliotis]QOD60679.1 hypothetical protein H9I45_15270 [Polaribacter haliotis]
MIENKLFHEIPKNADFHSAIMTTYSFDFYHFESQVLKTLKSKGVTNISVFADTTMLDQSIGFATSHLKSLSTSYSVCGVPCKGAFHPKIILLAGEEEVMLIQGSGNITSGGHGKNHELFNVFYANKDDKKQLPLIQEAWLYLKELNRNVEGISKEKLNWVSSNCNLLKKSIKVKHKFYTISDSFRAALLYNSESGIWNQLNKLISLKRATKIHVFSPFYDENGALLKKFFEANNTISINAFLQPNKGIHPFKMDQGENIHFYSWESTTRSKKRINKIQDRKLHSKVFHFVIDEEVYLLFGSPNATISAFGSENYRGINDEFAVLIHLNDKTILEELGLNGVYENVKPQDNKQAVLVESEIEEEQKENQRKIKLLGVDNNRGDLTVFIYNSTEHEKAMLAIYNHWGEILEKHTISLKKDKIKITLDKKNNTNTSGYVQFLNEENVIISNKQVINNLQDLWNTNPSVENRKLMKLSSLLETGDNKVFDVINFFNDIHSNRQTKRKEIVNDSGGIEEKEEEHSPSDMTYEQAIAFNEESQKNKEVLSQHNTVKVWDAIEKHFSDLTLSESEDDMDDEEEADATDSRERKGKKERTSPIEQNSIKVLENNRKNISRFFDNYIIALKKISASENYEVGIVDYAMLLIVLNHLMQYSGRKVILKKEVKFGGSDLEMLPTLGNLSQLDNFSGALLNILGAYVNVFSKSQFKVYDDDFHKKKAQHYMQLVKNNMLFLLSIFKKRYTKHSNAELWGDVLAYNILNKFGELDVDYADSLTEFYKNISIKEVNHNDSLAVLKNWHIDYKNNYSSDNFYDCKDLGLCLVNKFLPTNDNKKFIKIVRPGFDFDDDEKDFILKELYQIDTGKLMMSKQEHNKSKIKKISI